MLEIYIRGSVESGFLELAADSHLDMEALADIFDEDISTGEFSLPIDIPWTENNRRLLGFIERNSNFSAQSNFWTCDVLDSGYPQLQNAKLTILEKSGNFKYTTGKFSASISGTKGLFASAIKSKMLRKDFVLGGPINFVEDCRTFATNLEKGVYPQFPQIGFAPVAIENFFDTSSSSYNGEFLAQDTVNNIVHTGGGLTDWQFGRPSSSNPAVAAVAGDPEFIDHRTVPFYRLKFILVEVLKELGYTATGDLIDNYDIDDVFMFNTTALEFYSLVAYADYTRKIFPADHVPDILASDFVKAALKFFNVYTVFSLNSVDLRYRQNNFTTRKILDISDRCTGDFSGTWTEDTDQTGFTVDYDWDEADDMRNDRVKDPTTKTFVATVATLPNLATLDIGRPFTTDDIALVESENMYYNVANATTIPVLWDAWGERLGEYKTGTGATDVKLGMGTLCTYVELDTVNALYVRRDKLGCRQNGSYWTDKYVKVEKPFSLRVFFIKKQLISGNEFPVSMNGDTTSNGTQLNKFSLSIEGKNGILINFLNNWLNFKQGKQLLKIPVVADKKFMNDLAASNTIQMNNSLFLLQQTDKSIPLGPTVDLELAPL